MAIAENEHNIEETQSTHSKTAQIVVLGVMCLMLVLVAVNAVFRTKTTLQDMSDNRTIIADQTSPAERSNNFNDRMANANRLTDIPEKVVQGYDEVVKEIREKPVFKFTEPAAAMTEWQKSEQKLVRSSRYDDYSLALGFGLSGPVEESNSIIKEAPPLVNTGSRPPPDASVAEKMAYVAAEIEKTERKMAALSSGEMTATAGLGGNQASFGMKQELAGQAKSTLPGEKALPGQELLAIGSMIRVSYDQKVMSDYTGPFRLRVTQDVYDVSNNYVLIPKGSLVSCTSLRVSNVNEPIQARMGYIVNYMVLPDGKKIDFSKQAGLDREGIAAVKDEVNRHLLAQFFGVAAYVLVADNSSRDSSNINGDGSYAGDVGENSRVIGGDIAEKYLSLVPTITINPGTNARIFIEEEMYIYPWEKISSQYVN